MNIHKVNRNTIVSSLRRELVGPSPGTKQLDCTVPLKFLSFDDARGPWIEKGSGQEILQRDAPTKRYGIGVLYPFATVAQDNINDAGEAATGFHSIGDLQDPDELAHQSRSDLSILNIASQNGHDENSNDLDLSSSNTYRPSSIGISFLAELHADTKLIVDASGGRYRSLDVAIGRTKLLWWLRSDVKIVEEFSVADLLNSRGRRVKPSSRTEKNTQQMDLHVELFSRANPYGQAENQRIITVCLVNRNQTSKLTNVDDLCLFQADFRVIVRSPEHGNSILPYPESPLKAEDEEEKSLSFLYRNFDTYAVGHGCAANWHNKDRHRKIEAVSAECLPAFETPSITPDIRDSSGNLITVSMTNLAGLNPKDDGFTSLTRVVELYEEWIQTKSSEIANLEPNYLLIAQKHLEKCQRCAKRMRQGLEYLAENPKAMKAFRLANHAVLLQQLHSRHESRSTTYNAKSKRFEFTEKYQEPKIEESPTGRGKWRAFQIAFILMSLQSSSDGNADDRKTVELIWFPTGGGKTEAYLGLTAFTLFMRRLTDPDDSGVHVLMRYTLRLLTTQQFQRASGLVCAMEQLRLIHNLELGETPFSIGIWVGGSNTPNTRTDAISVLNGLNKGDRYTENKFLLGRCPWCGAQMGPLHHQKTSSKEALRVAGYVRQGDTVVFKCPDLACPFSTGLPIYVIDEDIYVHQPSIVIGTVDKFAILTWKPEARALFGIGELGVRQKSPPGLIIQDELHLIAGPLGSMVGLFETVIEELCTDRRFVPPIAPKIVSSTATIRRYQEQIMSLYGRDDIVLFPPSGLEASDSFFATYAIDDDGRLASGRLYVGVHAPGLGSLQTAQVRTFTSLAQSPMTIGALAERDPWWTLLIFFNSLRELGTTLSLIQADIPDYLKVIANRYGLAYNELRRLWQIRELTGRLRSDEVPEAISDLEISCTSALDKRPVDICLASNILEVGIDIDRLSLMAVVGQPKSTSQYIQVTGRVGRRWQERPGLIVTIYTASKPRDRSHFEKFRTYHERLYAQVEPVSVTPFSPPVLDRALHAVMALFVRQMGNVKLVDEPFPYPADLIESIKEILLPRVRKIDPAEEVNFEKVFNARASEWKRWQRTKWGEIGQSTIASEYPLLRPAGSYATHEQKMLSWSTPTSMRNVDAECEAQITTLYLQDSPYSPEG